MGHGPDRGADESRPARWIAIAVLVVAGVVAYVNSFAGAFVLDDGPSILRNASLRHLATALVPPSGAGITVEGRPLLNLSLAIDHAIGGTAVWIYHATNLVIHLAAALALFGIIRRTLRLPGAVARRGWGNTSALGRLAPEVIGLAAAAWWAVHPLQTESVTYVVQRAESLMGCCYLVTLYAFIRAVGVAEDRRWLAASAVVCALGMAAKEVMVTAPLTVLAYDAVFVSGGIRRAWRARRGYYLALAATWVLLAVLVIGAGDRGGTIGARSGVSSWNYLLTQSRGIVHYAQLALWPEPLIFDYGADHVSALAALPYAFIDVAALGAAVIGLWRGRAAGFLAVAFFLILAPTSSVVGGTRQMLAEHRMYLPLAAIAVSLVASAMRVLGRRAGLPAVLAVAALVVVTVRRNADYGTELRLDADTVAKRPGNVHARYNYGQALADAGRLPEAIAEYEAAVKLAPDFAPARNNLANALVEAGRPREAIPHYQAALALRPDYAKAHYNYGNALLALGRKAEAADQYRAAVRDDPDDAEARDNLGAVLLDLGDLRGARGQFEGVLRLNPNLVETHCNLGAVLLLQGDASAAEREYARALQLRPGFPPAVDGLQRARAVRR